MASSGVLKYRFPSRWQAQLFLVSVAAPGILLMGNILRIAIADDLGKSINIEDVSKATLLDTLNPEFQYRLGFLYEWRELNGSAAVAHYKQAVALNPNRAVFWLALGRACFAAGDTECADQAYEHAAWLAPSVPRYWWEAANHYLVTGREEASLHHFRRFLELRPDDALPTLSLCLRAFNHPDLIWRMLAQGMHSTALKLSFVTLLSRNGRPEVAEQFWDEIVSSRSQFSFSAVQPYLEHLIAAKRFEEALKVWQDMQGLGVIHNPATRDSNDRIFNGGFEQDSLDAGFDWRRQPQDYLAFDFEDRGCYAGARCLHINFTVGSNADYEPIYEFVPVVPNQQYLLTAHTRSADLTSDSGPRLRVVDLECDSCVPVESEGTLGTTAWHEIAVSFRTGSRTRAIRVSLWRPHSRSFPMEIQGHLWLDSVSLNEVN